MLEINEISTLYPKDAKGIVKWLIEGAFTNIDKKKALRFIEALLPHAETTIKEEELDDAAKVVESYMYRKRQSVVKYDLLPRTGLTDKGVIFSFQPYNICGFAAGCFHFTIPYKDLKP